MDTGKELRQYKNALQLKGNFKIININIDTDMFLHTYNLWYWLSQGVYELLLQMLNMMASILVESIF
jgi:hypothetical protein